MPYNPQSKKLDPKTISNFFIGYCVGSRGSKFYCPSHTNRIIESDRAIYFEEDTNRNQGPREIIFREECVIIPNLVASAQVYNPLIDHKRLLMMILRLPMIILLIRRCKKL